MNYAHRPLKDLPILVRQILFLQESYLVGSGCEYILSKSKTAKPPRDFDLMIEPTKYMAVCQLIGGKPYQINTYGGIKILEGIPIDIFPMTLSDYIAKLQGNIAIRFNPFKVIRW